MKKLKDLLIQSSIDVKKLAIQICNNISNKDGEQYQEFQNHATIKKFISGLQIMLKEFSIEDIKKIPYKNVNQLNKMFKPNKGWEIIHKIIKDVTQRWWR